MAIIAGALTGPIW